MKKQFFYSVLALVGFLLIPTNTFATEWFVKSDANGDGTSWKNATSIQNACKSAMDGDIIYIASGNYVLPQGINITKAISLIGGFAGNENSLKNPNAQKNKAIFTGKSNRAFFINNKTESNKTILIEGLWFENFSPKEKNHGGALYISYSTVNVNLKNLNFKKCIVVASDSDDPKRGSNGGAIYFNNFIEPILLNIDNCTFDACSAKEGGAIYINNSNADAGKNINIRKSTFSNNYAAINGGGIYARTGNTIHIEDCFFNANVASDTDQIGNGGAIQLYLQNKVELISCTFCKNTATNKGSAIYGNGNKEKPNLVNIKNTVIVDNYASRQNNGRFALDADNIGEHCIYTLTDCIVANNKNAKNNIADMILYNSSSSNIIKNSIVNGNYYSQTTAEATNDKGRYKEYLTNEQLETLIKSRGVKDISTYKKK